MRPSPRIFAALLLSLVFAACGSTKDPAPAAAAAGNPNALAPASKVCVPVTPADFPPAMDANACTEQMYAKYGDAGFQAVNQNLISRALEPAMTATIGTSFQDLLASATPARQQQFTEDLLNFLISVYSGNPSAYAAPPAPTMTAAHANLEITVSQYKAFVEEVVVPALQSAGVPASDISACFAPPLFNASFMATVITCK